MRDGRISDLQDKNQNVALDVDFFVSGETLVVTDFNLFIPNEEDSWIELKDKEQIKKTFEQNNCNDLIFNHVASSGRYAISEIRI